MNENKIKKQLMQVTISVILVSIIVCVAVFIIFGYVVNAVNESDRSQMKIETQEYKNRIFKQLDEDFQILTTLSKAYEISRIMDDEETLMTSIIETNKANAFISLSYFSVNGTGVVDTRDYGVEYDVKLEDYHPYAQEVIKKALQGENAVSKMFDSEVHHQKVFVYAVPVYQDDEIVGVLSAGDTLEIFEDIVNGDTVMGGQGYIHLLDSEGDFLVRSDNTIVQENVESIFDGPYLNNDMQQTALEALQNQNSIYGTFNYKGEQCRFYIEPLELNGWSLFCANRLWGPTLSMGQIVIFTGGFLFLILILMFFLLYYGYYKFRKNSALLLHVVYVDDVTKAMTTLRFDQRLQEIQKKHEDYCIAAVNVHNFKWINNLFGINGGNKVLQYIKDIIEKNLNEEEFFCRDSADLFYIFLLETDKQTLENRLMKIITTISDTTAHAEYSYEISLYSGLSICGTREQALLALRSIQNSHRTSVAFYDSKIHNKFRQISLVESQMQSALQKNEFKLFLQPKTDLTNDRIVGAEALVRCQLSDGTFRYPNEFIPLFEQNGFCHKLDMYMVEQVCKQLRSWIDEGLTPIPISINQSKLLFANANYPDELIKITNKYDIPPSLITLEMLEGIATNDTQQINSQIEALHAKGFKISMDDFGSGYSSLNMLYCLKIDELKLDRGFMREVSDKDDNRRRRIVLKEIITFAKKLNISTVAEGIERQQDKEYVAALHCDYGQGYFYAKPMSAYDFSQKYMYTDHSEAMQDEV